MFRVSRKLQIMQMVTLLVHPYTDNITWMYFWWIFNFMAEMNRKNNENVIKNIWDI